MDFVRGAGGDQQLDFKTLAEAALGSNPLANEFVRAGLGFLASPDSAKHPAGAAGAMDWRDPHDLRGILTRGDVRA